MHMPQRTALAAALLLLAGSGVASADKASTTDLDKARAYFNAGAESYDQGKYEVALREFQHAHALSHNPILYFNMAACEEHEQHYQAAALLLRQYLIERSDAEDRAKVETRIKVLEERDDALKRPAGTPPEPAHLAPKPSEAAAPPPPPASQDDKAPKRKFTWVAAGVTGAAAVATVALGAVTMATHSSLQGSCGQTTAGCTDGQINGMKTTALVTDIMLGVTAAAAITTVVLFIVEGRKPSSSERASAPVLLRAATALTPAGMVF